jgi:hypothetical protein
MLLSNDETRIAIEGLKREVADESRDGATGQLVEDATRIRFTGTLRILAPGAGRIMLVRGDETLDSFDIEAAELHDAHLERVGDGVDGDDLSQTGLTLAVGDTADVTAVAVSQDGRKLVLSPANVNWKPRVTEVIALQARPFAQSCYVRGPGAEVEALAEGSTEVAVDIGGLVRSFLVDVTP